MANYDRGAHEYVEPVAPTAGYDRGAHEYYVSAVPKYEYHVGPGQEYSTVGVAYTALKYDWYDILFNGTISIIIHAGYEETEHTIIDGYTDKVYPTNDYRLVIRANYGDKPNIRMSSAAITIQNIFGVTISGLYFRPNAGIAGDSSILGINDVPIGIHITGTTREIIIHSNVMKPLSGTGVLVRAEATVDYLLITNNTVYDVKTNKKTGAFYIDDANHMMFINNLIYDPYQYNKVVYRKTTGKYQTYSCNQFYTLNGVSYGDMDNIYNYTNPGAIYDFYDVNPYFVDAENGDFSLKFYSDAINSGLITVDLDKDFVGGYRIRGSSIDRGAIEWQDVDPSVISVRGYGMAAEGMDPELDDTEYGGTDTDYKQPGPPMLGTHCDEKPFSEITFVNRPVKKLELIRSQEIAPDTYGHIKQFSIRVDKYEVELSWEATDKVGGLEECTPNEGRTLDAEKIYRAFYEALLYKQQPNFIPASAYVSDLNNTMKVSIIGKEHQLDNSVFIDFLSGIGFLNG